MAGNRLTVHIPQEANPHALLPLLGLMYERDLEFPNVKALTAFADENGLGSRGELQNFAVVCGLLQRTERGGIALSRDGKCLSQLRHEVKADLVHFMMYTRWTTESEQQAELWAYREIVNVFWHRGNVDVLSVTSSINEEIRNKAFEVFGKDVSFSQKSIRGARKWLEAIAPPVIDGNVFSRRYFCPPELALLASAWVARNTGGELGIDCLLTADRRERMCTVCLLDPSVLNRVLDWMLPLYPEVVVPGTTAGVYGRFLRFLKWPELSDLL